MAKPVPLKVTKCDLKKTNQIQEKIIGCRAPNSKIAVQAGIYVARAFVQMQALLTEYADLSHRIDALAVTYDYRFQQIFTAIPDLMALPDKSRHTIGFGGGSKTRRKKKL